MSINCILISFSSVQIYEFHIFICVMPSSFEGLSFGGFFVKVVCKKNITFREVMFRTVCEMLAWSTYVSDGMIDAALSLLKPGKAFT